MATDKPINLAELERLAIAVQKMVSERGEEWVSSHTPKSHITAFIDAASPDVVLRLVAALRECASMDQDGDWYDITTSHGIIDEATP